MLLRPFPFAIFAGLFAFLIRLPFCFRYDLNLGGDSSTVFLMAKRVLDGHHALYFYGQDYYGTIEIYAVAFLFKLFGASLILGGIVSLLSWSLSTAIVVYLLALETTGFQRIFLALFIVVGVPYTIHYSSVPINGFLAGIWLPLLFYIALKDFNFSKISYGKIFLAGLVFGFGWYTSKLLLPGVAAVGILKLWYLWQTRPTQRKVLELLTVGFGLFFVAFSIGYAPEWIYRLTHGHTRNLLGFVTAGQFLENLRALGLAYYAYFDAHPISRTPESIYYFMKDQHTLLRPRDLFDGLKALLGIFTVGFALRALYQFFKGASRSKQNYFSTFLSLLILLNILAVLLSRESQGSFSSIRRYLYPSALAFSALTGLFLFSLTVRFPRIKIPTFVFAFGFLGLSLYHTEINLRAPDQLRDLRQILTELSENHLAYGSASWSYQLLLTAMSGEKIIFSASDYERIPAYTETASQVTAVAWVGHQNESLPNEIAIRGSHFHGVGEKHIIGDHAWKRYER